jgi:hypothetical protein
MDITAWALVIDGKVVSIELQEPRWANARGKWIKFTATIGLTE